MADALAPTAFLDADHPDVVAFARDAAGHETDEAGVAAALFAAVREHIRYDPYAFDLRPEVMRASSVLRSERNWCVPKATLLAASCRALGVEARLGFADVRNHLTSPKLTAAMGTDVFHWHGYAVLTVDGTARKVSPAFNASLCERFGTPPLTFDGTADALLHASDGEGRRHMEYVAHHGVHDDLPFDQLVAAMHDAYGDGLTETFRRIRDGAFS